MRDDPTDRPRAIAESAIIGLNSKQRRVLERVLAQPSPAEIPWDDIASLLEALGATLELGAGSRVRVVLGERTATFHRPHPERIATRGLIRNVRKLLVEAGVRQ